MWSFPVSTVAAGVRVGILIAATSTASLPGEGRQTEEQDFSRTADRASEAREANELLEALDLYRRALELDSRWAEGWWYLGTILYELDRFEEAREALLRLVELEPEGGPGWALLGLSRFQVKEYQEALADLQRARSLGVVGEHELGYVSEYHAALLLTRFGHFEISWDVLTRLALRHSRNPQIVEAMGLSSLRLSYLPSEMPPLERDPVLRAGRAAVHAVAHRHEQALYEYRRLVERYPDKENVHYAFGVFLLQDDPDEAIRLLERELKISPSHVPARLQIAFEYLKRGEPERGLPFAQEAVRLDASSFPARNALGRILLDLDRVERAVEELEVGVRIAPESPDMRFALARAYARAGRREEAERERAEFTRLDRIRRAQREGPQAVGGLEPRP